MPTLDPDFIVVSGYFWKSPPLEKMKGRFVARWKYRWFVLYDRGDNHNGRRELEFIYFANERTQKEGGIYLGKISLFPSHSNTLMTPP
jgi:hypothetical protein